MQIKVSDFIADFLAKQGIKHSFVLTGGAAAHLIDSVAQHPDIDFICPQHEQAGAMAADAYARVTGNLGVAMATSGPGFTNLITGICCSYYDSVPCLFITGQVASFRLKGDTGVRQMGFQETETVEMCNPITKYAVLVTDPKKIKYELEKACYLAKTGRPGPVVVDFPDDLQRVIVETDELESFSPEELNIPERSQKTASVEQVDICLKELGQAKRPVMIVGWGVRLSGAAQELLDFAEKVNIPIVPTWGVMDMFPADHKNLVGSFGLHGTRFANFTVQNSDLVLAIGTRLDTHETGSPMSSFAREAKKIIVDIDGSELNKYNTFGMVGEKLMIESDAKCFLKTALERIDNYKQANISEWEERIALWKNKYPACIKEYYQEKDVNPYVFVKELSKHLPENSHVFVDTGCSIAWLMQGFEFKKDQRLYHAFNNTPMGYALPASIGGYFADQSKTNICVSGDGGFQMNIQEMATVVRHKIPVKIFLINNHGYSMIQQTQDQWFDSRYVASDEEGGLAFPDFIKVAAAYGFETINIDKNADVPSKLEQAFATNAPLFCNVEIRADHRVIPQCKFGRPIEDSEPLLERQEFFDNMIIKPVEASLKSN
jgi:acetolactate synthase I/II/III large subunit